MMYSLGLYLCFYYILIYGIKGFDVFEQFFQDIDDGKFVLCSDVSIMSEVILQESVVWWVGCLLGLNFVSEIMEGQLMVIVIGSVYDEVISMGKQVFSSEYFYVFGIYDLFGVELAGVLKNIIVIGFGVLKGKGLGKNIQVMFIIRGFIEMVYFGNVMGSQSSVFFGMVGIGDLVVMVISKNSWNFIFGYCFGQGEVIEDIEVIMLEFVEGVCIF